MPHKAPHVPQIAPAYTGRLAMAPVPSLRLPDEAMDPDAAYRFIHDELMLDGSSRLNLATFVTTWMDPQAEKLMAETFDKNMIDKDEYPATAAIESRCVQVVWEKFCRYFDVEPRYLPMEKGRYVITPEQVLDNIDEDTIGVVAILGTTFTGELEPIGEICAALDKLAAGGGL